jgi:hypothetical protein
MNLNEDLERKNKYHRFQFKLIAVIFAIFGIMVLPGLFETSTILGLFILFIIGWCCYSAWNEKVGK